jgi:thiol-disulfide isomerase/thioredoxin
LEKGYKMMKHLLIAFTLFIGALPAQAVDFNWVNANGEQHLSALKGKHVLLHFWASWCPPCRAEMPKINKWALAHPDVQVVMVSMDSDSEDAQAFYQQQNIHGQVNMGDMRQASSLGIRGLPTTIIIDAKGEVSKRHTGDIHWDNEVESNEVLRWL